MEPSPTLVSCDFVATLFDPAPSVSYASIKRNPRVLTMLKMKEKRKVKSAKSGMILRFCLIQ